jgi:hypothetical protein
MPKADSAMLGFVRALDRGAEALRVDDRYVTGSGVSLDAARVRALVQSGVIAGDASRCSRSTSTRNWLKRQMLDIEPFTRQHFETASREGVTINLSESPIARLAVSPASGGSPFLEKHHVEMAEKLRRLVERAGMLARMTTNYSAGTGSTASSNGTSDISDMAADARRELSRIHRILPHDCAAVAIDVCGFLKGLQQVEVERGWPRRSAKLVLRIALESLAVHYGFDRAAIGAPSRRPHRWMDAGARPEGFE